MRRLASVAVAGRTSAARNLEPAAPPAAAAPRAAALPDPRSFEEVVALAGEMRAAQLRSWLEGYVRLVRFEPGQIEIALADNAPADIAHQLGRRLTEWTGRRWVVAVSREAGAPTLREKAEAARDALADDMRAHPTVASVLDAFPGAKIVDVRIEAAAPAPEDYVQSPDEEADGP